MKNTGKNIIIAGLAIVTVVVGFFALKFALKAIAFGCRIVFHSWWTLLLFGVILVAIGAGITVAADKKTEEKLNSQE